MRYFSNDVASFYCDEDVLPSVMNLCALIKQYSFILKPFRGMNEEVRKILSAQGFQLYPTVKRTTLFYENLTNSFFKIIHPLTMKKKVFSLFANRARSLYHLSLDLLDQGIKVPRVTAYGMFKKDKKPFFVMKKIEGKSLNDILIKEKGDIPEEVYRKVMEEVARFHTAGYWLGDAHLSHIFIDDTCISGFIDIDSIRRNRPFRLKNLAKDLAGLNHPGLPLTEGQKKELLKIYMDALNIGDREQFVQMVKNYTERRWK
jgi:tRNA A-37 threonylcarbamoyl transferase component Bud32